jgi:uncharacterized membrane protein
MENLLVISFQDAKNAISGLNKLQELDRLGDITIYNYALIRKTGGNQFDLIQHEGADTESLPAIGAIGGSMIGLIGGPIGMAVGMLAGVMAGSIDEADVTDFSDEVLNQAKDKLSVGDFALVLDVEEDNDLFVNSYMEPLQGITVRTDIAERYDQYDNEQWDELNKEIDDEEKSLKTALDKDKDSIKAKIAKLKKERDERFEKIKSRSAKRKKKLEARIKAFDDKIKTAGENAKEKLKSQRKNLAEKLDSINKKLDWAFA